MMLPIVMEYNQDCTGEKYREIARAMGVQGVDSMTREEYRRAAIDAVRKLSADVGIPTKLEAIKEGTSPSWRSPRTRMPARRETRRTPASRT